MTIFGLFTRAIIWFIVNLSNMYNQMAFMIVAITNIMYKRQDKIT